MSGHAVLCAVCNRIAYADQQRRCEKCQTIICNRPICASKHEEEWPGPSGDGPNSRCEMALFMSAALRLMSSVAHP